MRIANLFIVLSVCCGGCYFGAGARVGVGIAGPGRGSVSLGGEGEAALGPWRIAAGATGGPSLRAIPYSNFGFAVPGSVLHGSYDTTTPAPIVSGTGGVAFGRATMDGRSRPMISGWGGASVLVDDPVLRDGDAWACEQRRDAVAFELGVRSFGRRIEIFAGPTIRHQTIACGPRM